MWLLALVLACSDEPEPKKASEEPCTPSIWYSDADGDGYGDPFVETSACEAPSGMVANHSDCDDGDATEYPGAVWYRDLDGDGTGDPDQSLEACAQPMGHIADATDCDDTDGQRYPGATWYADADADGYGDAAEQRDACGDVEGAVAISGDCDDADWFVHPVANEACDLIDNDCDGLIDDDDPDIDTFTQVLMYTDADGDGWGAEELPLDRLCSTYPGGSEFYGDCDDADPEIYPHRLDYNDGIDSDCDGSADVFYAASSPYGWSGSTSSSAFGSVIDSKDIDGDGRNEVIVGAFNEGDYVGSVKFIPGDVIGDRSSFPEEGRMWDGEKEEDRIGAAVDFAGDWDGDGVEDVVVSSSYRVDFTGLAYIVSTDQPSGSLADATHLMQNDVLASYFGNDVQGLGDINGDGLDDVLIGARRDSRVTSNGGSIVVAYGGDTDLSILPSEHAIFAESNWDQLGYAISEVGDADGDGVADFLVGAPYCDDGGTNVGCAYLLSAAELDAAIHLEGTTRFWGQQEAENVGMALASAGDFDGDGLGDMLIAGSNYDVTIGNEGVAYVVLGSTGGWASYALADSHLMLLGNNEDDKTGRYLNGVGDINGDGKDDVMVASPIADAMGAYALGNMGVVYGVLGGRESGVVDLAEAADLQILGFAENDYLGKGIAPAGDVDDDGIEDFWLGANGDTSYGAIYMIPGVSVP